MSPASFSWKMSQPRADFEPGTEGSSDQAPKTGKDQEKAARNHLGFSQS
jgi:hypothetical protein